MFSGTPCQIRALKSYLDKNYDNLILIDLFCHGVPSPKIWQRYLEFINPEKKCIQSVSFRDKRISWEDYSLTVKYDETEKVHFGKMTAMPVDLVFHYLTVRHAANAVLNHSRE